MSNEKGHDEVIAVSDVANAMIRNWLDARVIG
jgi:hypothetical protein